MTAKKFVLATIVAGVVMWVVAGLWHSVINAAFYAAETQAPHEGVGVILVAYLVLGALMALLYPLRSRRRRPLLDGLLFGLVIGLLWVFPHELAMAGAHGESLTYVFQNGAWHLVEQGLGGITVGLIYGRRQPGSVADVSTASLPRSVPAGQQAGRRS